MKIFENLLYKGDKFGITLEKQRKKVGKCAFEVSANPTGRRSRAVFFQRILQNFPGNMRLNLIAEAHGDWSTIASFAGFPQARAYI